MDTAVISKRRLRHASMRGIVAEKSLPVGSEPERFLLASLVEMTIVRLYLDLSYRSRAGQYATSVTSIVKKGCSRNGLFWGPSLRPAARPRWISEKCGC